jgi:hypothetical protein
VIAAYLKDSTKEPTLVWSQEMRLLLQQRLLTHIAPFHTQLEQYVRNKTIGHRKVENMPVYTRLFTEVVQYPQLAKEVRCAEYYLQMWNNSKGSMESVYQVVFLNNLHRTFRILTADLAHINFVDFHILLKSFTLAYAT